VKSALKGAVLLALALRLVAVLATDRVVADVRRYERVAAHLLDVSWNPYETTGLYPYPPPWAAAEAAALWFARRGIGSFAVNVKVPVLAADLLLVAVLAAAARASRASPLAPWIYAAHPVSLLVGGVHGQFDAIPLALLLLAVELHRGDRRDASALALAAAIATKSFPVLTLPFLALGPRDSWRSAARYCVIALAPGALLLLPFVIADFSALRRELLAYGGIADFGWTGLLRGAEWMATGALARSEARFWPVASFLSRALFLAGWAGLVVAARTQRLRLGPERAVLATMLAFSALYGLQSAQYLLWAVPFGLLWAGPADSSSPGESELLGMPGAYAAAATAGLVGFYLFLAPGTLREAPLDGEAALRAGRLWLGGSAATLAASVLWLLAVLRRARESGLRAATDASERPSISPSR
jgi:hypothetical protein